MGYIKRPEDNFVIKTFDLNRLNIFNIWSFEERILTAFLLLTKDCHSYQVYMTDKIAKAKKNDKSYKNQSKENIKKYLIESGDNSSDFNQTITNYIEYMQITYIKEYEGMCK